MWLNSFKFDIGVVVEFGRQVINYGMKGLSTPNVRDNLVPKTKVRAYSDYLDPTTHQPTCLAHA